MRIAVLEDDNSQLELIRAIVQALGHDCHPFESGLDILDALGRESYDLLVLDWGVPGATGFEVVKWVRANLDHRVPVLFVTDHTQEQDVVAALSAGADDYMAKPVRVAELLARMNALLRRTYPHVLRKSVELGGYRLDLQTARVRHNGEPVELKLKEFLLAYNLFSNPGRLLTRGYLLQAVWGADADVSSRSLDTHISRVRSRLNLRPENGFRLLAVYSHGYRLEWLGA
jgi:DNA-binding response OmpR family regulator